MGISRAGIQFLMACVAKGVDLSATCSLGQQRLYCSRDDVLAASSLAENPGLRPRIERLNPSALGRFADATPLLTAMGAAQVDVVDISDFEGANLLADLNDPIPEAWHGTYSLVIDGGVTEHLINAAQCLSNAAAMVQVGGHLISITPANDQAGHGLYQFGPEFYYRLLFDSGEFVPVGVLVCVEGVRDRWYSVADPAELGERITFATAGPADWYVCARRVAAAGQGAGRVQQSDYQAAWDATETSPDSPSAATATATAPATGSSSGVHRWVRRGRAQLGRLKIRSAGVLGLISQQPGVEPVDLARWSRS